MRNGCASDVQPIRRLQYLAVDFGVKRDNSQIRGVQFVSVEVGAGRMTCPECGGDGDWSKFHPEADLVGPVPCVDCKGTGKVWVSI